MRVMNTNMSEKTLNNPTHNLTFDTHKDLHENSKSKTLLL